MKTDEDWERLHELNQIYVIEKQREMEEEWQRWEEEQEQKNRKPARIKIINIPKEIEYENKHNAFSF